MLKLGKCIECETYDNKRTLEVPIIAGRCQYHYKVFRKKVCLERKKNRVKIKELIDTDSEPEIKLSLWYRDRMNEFTGICQECGEKIPKYLRHASVAHVLPKSLFPSIAVHPENCNELGPSCGCHSKYDLSWMSASKMKIFLTAIEKFKILEPFIALQEKRKIPEIFLLHAKS